MSKDESMNRIVIAMLLIGLCGCTTAYRRIDRTVRNYREISKEKFLRDEWRVDRAGGYSNTIPIEKNGKYYEYWESTAVYFIPVKEFELERYHEQR